MKVVTAGLGEDGRSKVIESREIVLDVGESGSAFDFLWMTSEYPPKVPLDLSIGDQHLHEFGLEDKTSGWMFTRITPDYDDHMHRTDTIDYTMVFSGEVTVELEDGDELLEAGDALVILGVAHMWRSGPDGCVLSSVSMVFPHLESETGKPLPYSHSR
jgi:hypothetical protein